MEPDVTTFLKDEKRTLMVVSTINPDGSPESAVVAFSVHEDGQIIFGTDRHSRKFENLQHDPRVAVVIGWDAQTLQLQGTAELAKTGLKTIRDIHVAKNPMSAKYADKPDQRWFLITPEWGRITDFSRGTSVEYN